MRKRGDESSSRCGGNAFGADENMVMQRFIGGIVGGVLQAFSSHPFDTIKSRVQCGHFSGVVSCCCQTWKTEGIRGFYCGLTPPLALGGVYNSILFGVNQFMLNMLTPKGHNRQSELPLWRTALSGQLTAPFYVLCITPMENVKVRLQLRQHGAAKGEFAGPISCICFILTREGPRGFLTGYVPTVISRLVGLPFYFCSYRVAKKRLESSSVGRTTMGKNFLTPVLSGCVAGCLFWLSSYPLDYVKTHLQSGGRKRTMTQVFESTLKKDGVWGFYRGFAVCMLRAIPANASVWMGVEWTSRIIQRNGY